MDKKYALIVGLTFAVVSIIMMFMIVEDKEQRDLYLKMGVYNLVCVGITYYMTLRIKKQRQERLDKQAE